jgi:hypothetical protein
VAQLAIADGLSQKDVAAIVTTSPHLTQYRPNSERSSPEWKRYEQAAKNYIGKVLDAAIPQEQTRQARAVEVAR